VIDAFTRLATVDVVEAVSRYLNRSGSTRENLLFLAFALIIAAIWITLFLLEKWRKSRSESQTPPARSVFDELCEAHRLSTQDVALLLDAAHECRVPTPAFLFVQPDHLDRLSSDARPKAAVYRQLRERLFGDL
jgi:hypothetical protein